MIKITHSQLRSLDNSNRHNSQSTFRIAYQLFAAYITIIAVPAAKLNTSHKVCFKFDHLSQVLERKDVICPEGYKSGVWWLVLLYYYEQL